MKFRGLWLGVSAIALAWCGAASAQIATSAANDQAKSTTLNEVVVTGERRTTNLQTTAIAATVLSQKELIRNGVVTVDQLQFVSPSLAVNNFGQGNNVDIRGIGKGETNSQTTTGVVTYRDGVATFPGDFQGEPYFDVAGIEVLRGPQGTFSGQNATGGAIIVNTRDPQIGGGYNGYLLGHYGNYNDAGLQGAINLPISDTLAARVAFNSDYHDTYYHISGLNGDPNVYSGSARLSLLWTPIPALKVSFKTDYDYIDNGGYFGQGIINPATGKVNSTSTLFDVADNGIRPFATDQFVRSILKVDYTDPSSGITLRSVTGYQRGRSGWTGDLDGAALPSPGVALAEHADETLWSQELNVISPSKGPLTWVLGAFYQSNEIDYPSFDIGAPPGTIDLDLAGKNPTQTQAVFGQVSYNLPAGFQLQAGVRYSAWSNTGHFTFFIPELAAFGFTFPQDQTVSGSNVTGKVALNWNLDPNNFLYAFVATGAKPGGLGTAIYFDGGLIPPPFRQEYVTDYEVGWKSKFFDNHVRTQLGFYYNDFQHFQVTVPIPNDPLQSTETNDPSPTVLYGFEGSAQAVFGDLSMNTNISIEHSSLGKFFTEDTRVATSGVSCDPNSGPATNVCVNLQGHEQSYAPDFTFNIGALYDFHLAGGDLLTPGVTYSYISRQWGTLFNNASVGDYLAPRSILGASLSWTHGSVVARLYGYNLTDDRYVSALISPIRLAGTPRQFGVSVMKTFYFPPRKPCWPPRYTA